MSSRKTTFFYSLLIAVASLAVGMVIASRLDLTPASSAQSMAMPPMNSAPLSGTVDASTFRNIAKAMSPAVVNIRSTSKARAQEMTELGGGGSDDLLERFFGGGGGGQGQGRQRQQPREQESQAAGTGFVISKDGLILTNNHVIEGATKIEVSFFGEESDVYHEAILIGRDPLTDSALIQIKEPKKDLTEVKFGDSDQMEPGDWVMAIGNPFGLAHTVSVGVISAKARSFPVAEQRFADVLQTDAAINPGNSGGPLLNARGEVVGINTAIYTDSRQSGNIGIGFAIPINTVREMLPQLRSGKITRGVIGVQVAPVPLEALAEFGLKERRGALVSQVGKGQPASRAGVEPGDVIVEFNGKAVKNRDQLVSIVTATKPGSTVPMKVLRDKNEKTLSITVDELNLEQEVARPNTRETSSNEPDEQSSQGFGITLSALTPDLMRRLKVPSDTTGVLVTDVEQGSPAFRQGLTRGDVILQINRKPVKSPQDAGKLLNQVPSGSSAFLLVLRGGQEQFFTCTQGIATVALEREIKLRFDSAEEARKKILALGATPLHGRRLQEDCLLDTDDEVLRRQRSVLRIRTEGGKGLLTFKGPVQPGVMKLREEHETVVADGVVLLTILEQLGLHIWFRYEKYREEFSADDVVIAIDETPVGVFVELEGGEDAINEMARLLERSPADYITDSYRFLFLQHRDAHGIDGSDMVFATRADA